jgi:hypothetical protein
VSRSVVALRREYMFAAEQTPGSNNGIIFMRPAAAASRQAGLPICHIQIDFRTWLRLETVMKNRSFNYRPRSSAPLGDDPWKTPFLSPAFSLMATLQSATLQADEDDEASASRSSVVSAVVRSAQK